MKIKNGLVELEDSCLFFPTEQHVLYTEVSGTRILVPMKLLVRLYEGSRYHIGQKQDWDKFCESLFENEK